MSARQPNGIASKPPSQRPQPQEHEDDALLSQEPVPQLSRAFWDRVLAQAGTPTRTRPAPSGNGKVIEPSEAFSRGTHSSHASPTAEDSQLSLDLEANPGFPPTASIEELYGGSLDESTAMSHCRDTFPEDEATNETQDARELSISPKSSFAKLFHRKKRHEENTLTTMSSVNSLLPRRLGNFDGPSEFFRQVSESSSTAMSVGFADEPYDGRNERRAMSTSMNWESHGKDSDAEENSHLTPPRPVPRRDKTPLGPSVQDPSYYARRQASGGLPRSPLYRSQSGESSSPERHPGRAFSLHAPDSSPPRLGTPGQKSPELLSKPPRRRTTRYRPRSQTYSYTESAGEAPHLQMIQYDSLSASPADRGGLGAPYIPSQRTSSQGQAFSSHEDEIDELNQQYSSPQLPRYFGELQVSSPREAIRSVSSLNRSLRSDSPPNMTIPVRHTPSKSRNLTPYISPYKPAFIRHPSQIQIPLPLPFSATPRTTSSHSAIPSASPLTPTDHRIFTPPSQRQPSSNPFQAGNPTQTPPPPQDSPSPDFTSRILSTSLSPLQPPRRLHNPAPMRVYNDALPASIAQPRTPADLQRRSRRNEGNPFNTAPPRIMRQQQQPTTPSGARRATPVATPTRDRGVIGRRLGRRNEQVENAGSVTPEERMWRRERGSRVGIGREERERLGLGRGDTEA
ncbi:MAG: hypothetical protein OHK93_006757 [Ramalina farinacea]|uniref:Uncharacterized protein n=1 Tax=Ramalina farinacea TaxID=258253 RepID=A0AA43TX09_9LECA|nr:hypothetical protein [Ramalina farinacea]